MDSTKGAGRLGGSFPERWGDGTNPNDPAFQVHRYDEHTWIIRQSLVTHWEAPFLYLFAGEKRALLIDTGVAGGFPLRETVDGLIGGGTPLVVAHSHPHGDHIAHDGQLAERPGTVVVGHTPEEVADFFEISNWPEGISSIDLGGRQLDIIPIPGHSTAHIALYDGRTGLLLTGDTFYPGRLYVYDFAAFRASIERLVAFTADREVAYVLGCHIEMTNEPGVDQEYRGAVHPDEHVLQLGHDQLLELRDAVRAMGNEARRDVHDHFLVVPR